MTFHPEKLLVASRNKGKYRELRAILDGLPVELVSLDEFENVPEVIEDGGSFAENAAKKACTYAEWSGIVTVADDSGLCVDALGGRPGVTSARYAGGDRSTGALCSKLLSELSGVPDELRTASFHCSVALAEPGRLVFVVEGQCRGWITHEMRGSEGFGYDPVFAPGSTCKTFAELTMGEKNRVSHRARALEEFRNMFEDYIAGKTG